jgi:hypothetical protein
VNRESRILLSRKAKLRVDRLTGETLLLYPEHGLLLNESAAAIVRLCDGREVREIAAALDAPLSDVLALLEALARRGLLKEAS